MNVNKPSTIVIRDGQWLQTRGTEGLTKKGEWNRSTNGTFVNSTEVDNRGVVLKAGDIISVGDTKLRVERYYFAD